MNLSFNLYQECQLTPKAQRLLAPLFIEQIKILHMMAPLSIIGVVDTGDALASELGQLLKWKTYTLPVVSLHLQDDTSTVHGAACAINGILTLDSELPHHTSLNSLETTKNQLTTLKTELFHEVRYQRARDDWLKHAQVISQTTALLVDPVMVSKPKLHAALQSLYQCGASRIILTGAFIYKPILLGNRFPLKDGRFLKWLDNLDELRSCVQAVNTMDERSIRVNFQAL